MHIVHNNNIIMINQVNYLKKVLECLRLTNAKAAPMPLPARYHALPNEAEVDPILCLRY